MAFAPSSKNQIQHQLLEIFINDYLGGELTPVLTFRNTKSIKTFWERYREGRPEAAILQRQCGTTLEKMRLEFPKTVNKFLKDCAPITQTLRETVDRCNSPDDFSTVQELYDRWQKKLTAINRLDSGAFLKELHAELKELTTPFIEAKISETPRGNRR